MSAAHTPGPWRVANQNEPLHEDGCIVESCNGQEIRPAVGVKLGDENADLALIAAAPELLEALQPFLRAPSVGSAGPGSITIAVQEFNLRAARAAIAKATGGAA